MMFVYMHLGQIVRRMKQFLRVAVSSQIIPFLGTTISDWDIEGREREKLKILNGTTRRRRKKLKF